MRNSSTYEKRLKALLGRLRKTSSPQPPPDLPSDPVVELIWSALLEDCAEGTAKVGLSRLTGHFVDFNELRVSRAEEIVEVLPNTMSDARERALRITAALQAIFDKFDTLQIAELREQPKREARGFVASVPRMTPFVEGRVCLFALNIHAMPVDRRLVELLRDRGAVHPETDPRDTQGFLERVIPAKDALEVALLLEALRQDPEKVPAPKARPAPPAAAARRSAEKGPRREASPAAARKRPGRRPAAKK